MKETIRKLAKEFGGNLTGKEILQLTGLSRNILYK
jgi:predicted DNA-binding transcriptional regulator AlpA